MKVNTKMCLTLVCNFCTRSFRVIVDTEKNVFTQSRVCGHFCWIPIRIFIPNQHIDMFCSSLFTHDHAIKPSHTNLVQLKTSHAFCIEKQIGIFVHPFYKRISHLIIKIIKSSFENQPRKY